MSLRVWISTSVWPERRSSAAGVRVWQWLERFQSRGFTIALHSAARTNGGAEEAVRALETAGVRCVQADANDPALGSILREWRPDWVWMDRYVVEEQCSWRALRECPQAMRILDTQDLHFLRLERAEAFVGERKALGAQVLRTRQLRELASILRSDVALVLSSVEIARLVEELSVPERQVLWSPYAYADPMHPMVPFGERRHALFIGNYRHAPNLDAAMFLANALWPQIRPVLPTGTELHLYGAYMPREISALDGRDGIRALGQAKDAYRTIEKYRCLLAPIRFGAGIKGKVTDAWFSGTPVVTTHLGSEGLWPDPQGPMPFPEELRLDDWTRWPEVTRSLFIDQNIWQKAAEQGQTWVAAHHHQSQADELLDRLMDRYVHLAQWREDNRIGQILMDARSRWTELFSKRIASKQI